MYLFQGEIERGREQQRVNVKKKLISQSVLIDESHRNFSVFSVIIKAEAQVIVTWEYKPKFVFIHRVFYSSPIYILGDKQ